MSSTIYMILYFVLVSLMVWINYDWNKALDKCNKDWFETSMKMNREWVELCTKIESERDALKKRVEELEAEQLEQCPIYGGMCAYPSDQCYDCPRHAGAKMGVTE